jgi:hypothetical protein
METYDFYLFQPKEGTEPGQVLQGLLAANQGLVLRKLLASGTPAEVRQAEVEALRSAAHAPPGRVEMLRAENLRLSESLRERQPALTLVPEAPNWKGLGASHVQLRHSGHGGELLLTHDYVHVTVPLSLPEGQVRAALADAAVSIRILERARGFQTYDPQLGRLLRLPDELDVVLEHYAGAADTAMRPAAPPAPKKPWWRFW